GEPHRGDADELQPVLRTEEARGSATFESEEGGRQRLSVGSAALIEADLPTGVVLAGKQAEAEPRLAALQKRLDGERQVGEVAANADRRAATAAAFAKAQQVERLLHGGGAGEGSAAGLVGIGDL